MKLIKMDCCILSTQNKGDKLLYQMADKPEGPWSEPKAFALPIPEVDPKVN